MKIFTRIFIIICCFELFAYSACAQKNAVDQKKAFSLVKQNAGAMMLTEKDITNSVISDFYTTAGGVSMLYLQEAYKGIPVYNQIQTAAFKNDRLVSFSGTRISKMETKVNKPDAVPVLTPEAAVQKAALHLKLTAPAALLQIPGTTLSMLRFSGAGISQEDITVQALWTPVDSSLMLSWQVFIVPLHSSDYWLVRVNALTGTIIEKSNLTVNCQWDKQAAVNTFCAGNRQNAEVNLSATNNNSAPLAINSSNYRVIPFPAESPIHPGGTDAVISNPWTAASANAGTLAWNSDGVTDYIISRGNNVYAHEDRSANNSNGGLSDTSSTALPDLNFLQAPDYTQVATLRANQKFATTNLFYWNNIMHDISYVYGFDEVSGNFQSNNLSRGGLGNDYVQADAQDASGTNNANFSTPVDGSQPRMQMYLFTYGTPGKDGDLDNGVISHEYTHGISNRLTGGPSTASCLLNAEQMGEGWSDYFALMVTTNWTTATTSDGALSHPIGNYVLNNATTGAGIRNYPYSTDMTINPQTYANVASTTGGEVHNIGEIWAAMLWDMTWNIIQTDGINTNLYNPTGAGGNSVALKLVTEGMRLQPCSPGFVDGRDAILKADTLYYAGVHSCAIWEAFARRGLGVNASQGSSGSYSDGTADYLSKTGLSNVSFTANQTQVAETDLIDYTTQLTAGSCGGISNYYITDTIPANVTWISGGSYNSTNRVATFSPVTLAAGASSSYTLRVQVNAGAYFMPATYINETVPAAAVSATWTTSGTTPTWATTTARSHSASRSFFAADPATVADKIIATTSSYTISGVTTLSFWHYILLEPGYDGGVVEISTNGGGTWSDLGSYMTFNGYNYVIPTAYSSPIAGRSAYSGNIGGWYNTTIDLTSFSGQTVKIRFRMGSDNSTAGTGWYIDDITLTSTAYVINKTNVYNSANVLQSTKSINTPIVPVLVTSTGGTSTKATYATLAAAVTAINGGTIHTGTIVCSVTAGYSETAPIGGYSITATGSASNSITFQRMGIGANPILTAYTPQASGNINDAVFKIIGGDYITITGFTIQENSANTTTTTASNNMTEFGIAMFYASATNGAQHNTILNNTISLNRTYLNTFGIYSNARHTATSMTVLAEATSTAGSNSFNSVYGNTISNVNYGIIFIGAGASAAVMDNGNDIGGSSSSTGNTISNWGNAAAASSYVSLTGSTYCIYTDHQYNSNISYNAITSAPLTVSTAVTGGISQKYSVGQPTGTISSTVSNNTITVTNTATTGNMVVIDNQGLTALSTATVNISNNTLANCVVSGASATSAAFTGISNTSVCGTLNINSNIIRGISSTATSGVYAGIYNNAAVISSENINSNQIGNATGNAVTFSNANSANFFGIENLLAANTCTTSIQSNDFRGIVYSTTSTGPQYIIYNTATPAGSGISSNTFTALSLNTNGAVYILYNNSNAPAAGTKTVQNNSIVTSFSRTGAGAAANFYGYYDVSSSGAGSMFTISGNNFSNISAGSITSDAIGFNFVGSNYNPTLSFYNNTVNNFSVAGAGTLSGARLQFMGGSTGSPDLIYGNTLTNISATGSGAPALYGLDVEQAVNTKIYNNSVNTLSNTSGSTYGIYASANTTSAVYGNTLNTIAVAGNAYGLYLAGGTTQDAYKNKVYDLSATAATSLVYGAYVPAGNAVALKFHNNYIGDLRNTAATYSGSAVTGIYLAGTTASSAENIYFNTVYLAASSSGANFSSSGIYHTTSATASTAALDLRNNIIINQSTANGSGKAAAYRRSDMVLTNYAASSNYNLLYAGMPGANNLIYYDGTNADQSLAAFRYRVTLREDKTVSDNPTFLSNTGSNANYLHIDPTVATRPESGGIPISGITDDYDGDTRNASAPDIGADEFTGILKDSTRPVITINTTVDSCTGTRRVRATITDATGIPLTGTLMPRIYYKKGAGTYQSVAGINVSGTATNSVWDFLIDPVTAGATTGDGLDYFIVAQDIISTVANIGSSPAAGLYAADVNTIVKDPSALNSFFVGPIATAYTWLGNNNNWFSTANWCGSVVPGAANDVVIPAGTSYYPIISSGTASTKNISISTGASVTVNSTGIFSLNGTISNSGTFSLVDGTLDLAGSGSVSVSGSSILNGTVKNLTVSKSAAITSGAGKTLKVSGQLSFLSSGNILTTNDNLTLLSSAAGTASVTDITHNGAVLLTGNSISGNASVERYISAQRKWNFLSVNTGTTQTVQASWMEGQTPGVSASTGYGLWVTDAAGSGANFDATSFTPTIKWWNGSSYTGITDPTVYALNNHAAYMTFVRGDRGSTGSNSTLHNTVLRSLGTIIQNSPAATVIPAGTGYTQAGNPYPSAIDLTKLNYSASGAINLEIWDPNLTGGQGLGAFQTFSATGPGSNFIISPGAGSYGVPTGSVMNTIESGQAFFMQGSAAPRNVTFVETAKAAGAHLLAFAPDNEQRAAGVLSIMSAGTATIVDGFMSRMSADFNTAVDNDDARKFSNTNENVSLIRNNILLAMEYRGPVDEADTIFINIGAMRTKDYEWNFSLTNMDQPGRIGLLVDQFTGVESPLNLSGSTLYDFSVNTAIAASAAANRFYIVFRPATVVPVTFTSISAVRQADKTILVKWTAQNEVNIDHYEIERSANGATFYVDGSMLPTANNGGAAQYNLIDHLPLTDDNYYRIKAFSNNGQYQYSAIVKVSPLTPGTSISVYPNPLTDRLMNIHFTNKTAGKYSLQLLNKAGQQVYKGSVKLSGSNEIKSIALKRSLVAGGYQLVIRDERGERVVVDVVAE